MCGIAGYIGNDGAAGHILSVLADVEYRGYDSAGIAVLDKGKLTTRKGCGFLKDVSERLSLNRMKGNIGIGHVRWATHGKVCDDNAHPIMDCHNRIAVVHNGTIDNFEALRVELERDGHVFRTDTDTEVIAHLLEDKELSEAVKLITGSYALLAIREGSGNIQVACYRCPVIITRIDSGVVLSSSAIDDGCSQYILHDGEVLTVDENFTIPVKESATTSYSMLSEIMEQPDILMKTAMLGNDEINQTAISMLRASQLMFAASGTSRYASLLGRYLLSHGASRMGEVMQASEFPYFAPGITKGMAIIAVSQSGETADVINCVRTAKEREAYTLGITNSGSSQLVRLCDNAIVTRCGVERGVAATKTFTGQAVVFYLLRGAIMGELDKTRVELGILSDTIRRMLPDCAISAEKVVSLLDDKRDFYYLGRGINFSIAGESALKMKEVSYIHAEGLAGGELKHGTLALVDSDTIVCGLCPDDYTYKDLILNLREVKSRGGTVIGVSDKNSDVFDEWVAIPRVSEQYYPLLCVIAAQLMAYYAAVRRGLNPDRPRSLAKSVTVL